MTEEAVTYSVESGIAKLMLNRPDNKNALSVDLINALGDGLTRAGEDESVRLVQLTNSGNTFCAGADLKDRNPQTPARYSLVDIFALMRENPKPVIGSIHGHCAGGGVGLAAACDISVIADDALVGFTEVRIGVAPAIISVICLPKMRVGDAMELFLSGERISGTRAAEVGLLNYATPRGEVDAKVGEISEKLVRGGPVALSTCKQLITRVPSMSRKEAFAWTAQLSAELFKSDEAAAGIAAFVKRTDAPWVPGK